MTIGPKKKISKHKWRLRHAEWQRRNLKRLSDVTNLVVCKNCWKVKLSHRVCPHCGFYGDKQVITIKSKSKETVIES